MAGVAYKGIAEAWKDLGNLEKRQGGNMQGSRSLETLEEMERFAELMADPDRMGLSVKKIAEKFNIGVATIYNRLKDPEIRDLVKEKRAGRVKMELPEIDKAVLKKAEKGDVRAAELIYERWDDYLPHKGDTVNFNSIQLTQSDGTP